MPYVTKVPFGRYKSSLKRYRSSLFGLLKCPFLHISLSLSLYRCSLQFLLRTMKPICITTTVPWFLRGLTLINECMYTTYAPLLVFSNKSTQVYVYARVILYSWESKLRTAGNLVCLRRKWLVKLNQFFFMNYEVKLIILINMLESDLCVFCFLTIEQRQRRKERRAAMQTDQVVQNLAAEWHHFWIINIPNNQWQMYLQCQNHSLPSNYNHCRLDLFEKKLKLF